MSAYEHIKEYNRNRHVRENYHSERCRNCGAFISIPSDASGETRIKCKSCNHWILKYVPQNLSGTSD